SPGLTEEMVRKAHATYMGEIAMVDTWIGFLLRRVENMGLMDNTAIIFTSDHGFYFGEHGGLFGKLTFDTKPNGALYVHGEEGTTLDYSPLYEELVKVPLLIYFPGALPSVSTGLSSAVDLMPTVLDMLGQAVPDFVDGESLLPRVADAVDVGREFVVSTIPFANPGETTRSFDHIERQLRASPVTTITSGDWSLLYSMDEGVSALHDLSVDPRQENDVISERPEVAKELHSYMLKFLRDTKTSDHLIKPRLQLML
ncbi:MAG: sulfatase-like hydrolase/transferase, partial [SAR202 cluster bacterium]|nr:sulfatase-like hydrolase/transferase [SAR202 cluster bacterium]